ncbi:hypothetical protein H920_05384 [Fukomys damarensis]|uniref:Uncharacterized protein n=2 Tax=Fukomys damarensis TaxID=885580 RepID=A0A091ED20_FUKDA|nr:hypothetical protein H920_05384 [Fukomys damarensis]
MWYQTETLEFSSTLVCLLVLFSSSLWFPLLSPVAPSVLLTDCVLLCSLGQLWTPQWQTDTPHFGGQFGAALLPAVPSTAPDRVKPGTEPKTELLFRCLLSTLGKYVYQPMTPVEQLPSTEIPARPREPTNTIQISVSLTEHFLKFASVFQPPLPPDSPRYCMISDLFLDNYQVKCINGKMCYVQKQPAPHSRKMSPEVSARDALISEASSTPKIDQCSSPSSSEDSGINAIGAHYVESCDEDTEEGAELSSEEDYSPESSWEPDECTLLSPSQSDLEVIETIETTV